MSCIVISYLTLFLFSIQNNKMLYWIGNKKCFSWVCLFLSVWSDGLHLSAIGWWSVRPWWNVCWDLSYVAPPHGSWTLWPRTLFRYVSEGTDGRLCKVPEWLGLALMSFSGGFTTPSSTQRSTKKDLFRNTKAEKQQKSLRRYIKLA